MPGSCWVPCHILLLASCSLLLIVCHPCCCHDHLALLCIWFDMPCVILLHSIMIIMWVAFFMLMYCSCAVHLDISHQLFSPCAQTIHFFIYFKFCLSCQVTLFLPPLMFICFLVIVLHVFYLSAKLHPFWSCFGWLKNGSSLNLIQTWIIFLPLKIAKSIYYNPS